MMTREGWEKLCFPERTAGQRDVLRLTDGQRRRIVIYGAGYGGLMFLECLRGCGLEPECLLDASPEKQGRIIFHVPVYALCRQRVEGAVVIVCLLRMDGVYRQIREQMEALGCLSVFHLYELRADKQLFWKQPLLIAPDCERLRADSKRLYQAYQLLGDRLSRETFVSVLQFLNGDLSAAIPSLPLEDQYFAKDIYTLQEDEIFVDCGAHIGEILQQFLERSKGQFHAYWAFEPDAENIRMMKAACPAEYAVRVMFCHTALGDRCERVRVRNYDGNNSIIHADGEQEVGCVPLDSFAEQLHPTILKIDVEGWEMRLLIGARKMICRDKPLIAAAVYHRERDFWRILLLLKQWVPEYRFYLRSYMNVSETILYAIPFRRGAKGDVI